MRLFISVQRYHRIALAVLEETNTSTTPLVRESIDSGGEIVEVDVGVEVMPHLSDIGALKERVTGSF